jgi:hypothetical protein
MIAMLVSLSFSVGVRALRLGQIARLVEAQIDVTSFIATLEFPGLHAGAHHRDLIGLLVGVIAAGLQGFFPDADAADRDKDGGELAFICFLRGDGFAARIRRYRFLIAGGRLICDQVAEMHGIDDVGLDAPDETLGDIDGVIDAELPEIGVEPVISRRQDRRLRPTLAAMGQEVLGVEHIQLMFSGKSVGQVLIGPKRRPVLGVQEPVFARWDGDHFFVFDLINDVDGRRATSSAFFSAHASGTRTKRCDSALARRRSAAALLSVAVIRRRRRAIGHRPRRE